MSLGDKSKIKISILEMQVRPDRFRILKFLTLLRPTVRIFKESMLTTCTTSVSLLSITIVACFSTTAKAILFVLSSSDSEYPYNRNRTKTKLYLLRMPL